jgi:IrrE N-terminal-like domain
MTVMVIPDPQDRIADIRDLAEYISEENHPDGAVDPEAILRSEGVRICFGDFGDSFEGLLEWREGRFYVYCNLVNLPGPKAPRARFTLAHEAGHYFIDEHRNALVSGRAPAHASWCDFRSPAQIEREADIFASYLLMPRGRFNKEARRYEIGFSGIRMLASKYGTSLTSTALRYIDDVLDRAAIIYWAPDGLKWRRLSSNWGFGVPRRTIGSFEDVVPGSATYRLLQGDTSTENGIIRQGTVASAWFPGVKLGWKNDDILVEEAMSLGKYGALTLLYPDARS